MIRVDLHCHTFRSIDSATSYKALIAACQRRAIGALAITDHNHIEGALEMADQPGPVQIVIGEEIRTTEGEIIGLFLREFIPPRLSPEETVAEIRAQGGVVYVPHPFDRIRRSVLAREALDRIAHRIDAVEVLNARLRSATLNEAAAEFARANRLLAGAGSDAHIAYEVGRVGVEMPEFRDAASFKESLRQGRIFGTPSHPLVHAASAWTRLRKKYLPGWRSI